MKKISKATTKKKFSKNRKHDSLYSKDVISIDNPKNENYLDNIVYQEYLKKLNSGSSDFNEK